MENGNNGGNTNTPTRDNIEVISFIEPARDQIQILRYYEKVQAWVQSPSK